MIIAISLLYFKLQRILGKIVQLKKYVRIQYLDFQKWSDADIGSELEKVLCYNEWLLNSLCFFVSFWVFLRDWLYMW